MSDERVVQPYGGDRDNGDDGDNGSNLRNQIKATAHYQRGNNTDTYTLSFNTYYDKPTSSSNSYY